MGVLSLQSLKRYQLFAQDDFSVLHCCSCRCDCWTTAYFSTSTTTTTRISCSTTRLCSQALLRSSTQGTFWRTWWAPRQGRAWRNEPSAAVEPVGWLQGACV